MVKFKPYICNRSHNLTKKVLSANDAATVFVERQQLQNSFIYMSNDEVINSLKNDELNCSLLCVNDGQINYKV